MKKFLIVVAVVAIFLVAGCAGGVKTCSDSAQTINIGTNQEFVIALDSNPTTGYGWLAGYGESILELMESKYEMGEDSRSSGIRLARGGDYCRTP